ncbi:MAG TPA: 16S rRNA (uracil(1498)-N(3))-methyltransferase [Acidimicrobiia bacterium]|nr:16S rRNA (uracil(1498)-N(3))-methyltransferase [Acidimicrobiia bacterium]
MKHVPHLYLPGPWREPALEATGEQVAHMRRVLRIDDGSEVTYTDGVGEFGHGKWSGNSVIRGDEESRRRPGNLVLAVAPPANRDRVRFVVEKLAEVGVESLLWLATRHGTGRVPSLQKQRGWAISALEQSRGFWLMALGEDLVGWADLERPLAACLPGEPGSEASFRTLAIGPEGGFDPGEIPKDARGVGLGETILRVETAALAAAVKFH